VERGGEVVGLAQAGAREGCRRSDLAAPGLATLDVEVGRDSGWKAAGLAQAGTEDG
jgi:hypothetical protein